MICRAYDVKLFSDLDDDDIHETQINEIINYAWEKVMSDTSIKQNMVKIDYIDRFRKNRRNGSNTTFYINESWTRYFGDLDYDQSIGTGDLTVWEYKNDDTREERTVSSIDEVGSFVLNTAPESGSDLVATYITVPISITDSLYKRACMELTTSMCYGKLDAGDYRSIGFRGLTLDKLNLDSGMDKFYRQYIGTVREINQLRHQTIKRRDDVKRDYPLREMPSYVEPRRYNYGR